MLTSTKNPSLLPINSFMITVHLAALKHPKIILRMRTEWKDKAFDLMKAACSNRNSFVFKYTTRPAETVRNNTVDMT